MPSSLFASAWLHRNLIKALSKRDVIGRYKGSFLGLMWSLINPLIMLTVYTFVFSVVFKARWGSTTGGSGIEFALLLFSGLMVFNIFSENILKAPSLVTGNVNYVKKVVFPIEVLPWVSLVSALFHFAVSTLIWVSAHLVFIGGLPITALCLPLILAPLCLLTLGVSWVLASISVYFRDIGQFIGPGVTVLLFLSPIFYPASALPQRFQTLFWLNPLSLPIEMIRDALFWGKLPDFNLLGVYSGISIVAALVGFRFFQATKRGFADAL